MIVKVYFGTELEDSMFGQEVRSIDRRNLTPKEVREEVEQGVISLLHCSRALTAAAMWKRFGINISTPENPPKVNLGQWDSIIVMGPGFTFTKYTVNQVEVKKAKKLLHFEDNYLE